MPDGRAPSRALSARPAGGLRRPPAMPAWQPAKRAPGKAAWVWQDPAARGHVRPPPWRESPGCGGAGKGQPAGKAAGYIFACNNSTQGECERRRLMGSPASELGQMRACIAPGLPIFLLNMQSLKIFGPLSAASAPALNLEPDAFGRRFHAQLRVAPAGAVREAKLPSRPPSGAQSRARVEELQRLLREGSEGPARAGLAARQARAAVGGAAAPARPRPGRSVTGENMGIAQGIVNPPSGSIASRLPCLPAFCLRGVESANEMLAAAGQEQESHEVGCDAMRMHDLKGIHHVRHIKQYRAGGLFQHDVHAPAVGEKEQE
ncbi:unnamed protein product [Prorocentrum cordatum]|uniref:DCD domain-containing protein n=1 Tax=Prorocentrum cordatum TaxID=2364126 RepID=A0ABN9WQH0_9DINO|nr:unnamed protein product [Polarella glacialis]